MMEEEFELQVAPPVAEPADPDGAPAAPVSPAEPASPPGPLEEFELPPSGAAAWERDWSPAVAAGKAAGYEWRRVWWPGFGLAGAFLVLGAVLAFAHPGPVRDFMIASLEVLPF